MNSRSLWDRLLEKDLEEGHLRLYDEVNVDSAEDILVFLNEIKRRKIKHITLHISSPGGGAYYALAIYDALKAFSNKEGNKITAIVEGLAASAACMIVLQAADERLSYPNARFLLHEIKRWAMFDIKTKSELEDEVDEMIALSDVIFNILSERCDHTREEIEGLIKRKEFWMSAEEAKEWNLIDRVIE